MYETLEHWNQYKKEQELKKQKAKMALLYAAIAECFEMNV